MVDILFATDFSTVSVSAGHFAGLYARQLGARLHLLHVLHRSDPGPDPNHRLSELARQIGAPQDSITEVVTGAAADEIVDYARRNDIALIVVGTHGRTGFSRTLLGSVAEQVMRHASCPVMTVAGHVPFPGDAQPWPAAPGEHCVVCTELSRDLICRSCRARIRGHAPDRRLQEMRTGPG